MPDPNDIDTRMANLLKDHQEMGARPMQELDNGDRPEDTTSVPDTADTVEAKPKKATRKKK